MTRGVLLDANVIIGAFDGEDGNQAHADAKRRLAELMQDPEVKIAISPLIRYEVLRGVRRIAPEDLESILNDFTEFEVRAEDARLAAAAYKAAKDAGTPIGRRDFDLFHCVCAHLNRLELMSMDEDMERLRQHIRQVE